MKKRDLFLLFFFVFSLLLSSFGAFAQDCREIRESSLRLHILANSDSQEDQALKLKVRDRVLAQCGGLFSGTQNAGDAKAAAQAHLDEIVECAQGVLRENGCHDSVGAQVVNMYFETRVYDGFTMPAGDYDAVRITIGEAEGHNWWCVLFPPLCLPAAESTRQDQEQAQQYCQEHPAAGESPEYEMHFAIWDWIQSLLGNDGK